MRAAQLAVLVVGLQVGCAAEQPAVVSPPGSGGGGGTGAGGTSGVAGTLGTGGTSGVAGASATGGTSALAGAGGTGGSAGGGRGGSAAAGRGGSGAAGTVGGAGGPAGGAAGVAGAAGIGGPSLCTPGKYVICEDFEATAVGAIPTGWTKSGAVSVADDQAARGVHALKVGPAVNGPRRINGDASRLGSGHWGRVFYRVQLPAPISCDPANSVLHATFVALQGNGPVGGAEEVRVVDTVENAQGMHQWLYNVQPSGSEFGKGSPYNWKYDGVWHCAEWHIDNPTQSYHFYLDGAEVTSIALNNGAGNYTGTDIPASFSQVRIGVYNYQQACSPYLTVWLDELAMDPTRIGCGN